MVSGSRSSGRCIRSPDRSLEADRIVRDVGVAVAHTCGVWCSDDRPSQLTAGVRLLGLSFIESVMTGVVVSVALSGGHTFSKTAQTTITLRKDFGVEGDAHAGRTVKHRSRVARDPTQPNLRQVHLIATELFVELAERGFTVKPGDMGENITTQGIPLLELPRGTQLRIGRSAIVELTGLRNPCVQIERFQAGLLAAVLDRDAAGNLVRKTGVMAIVLADGVVAPDDTIAVTLPSGPHEPLLVV